MNIAFLVIDFDQNFICCENGNKKKIVRWIDKK